MRINTLIDKLCVKDELDKEDLGIINSLLKEKYSESKKYNSKVLIDSISLIHQSITKKSNIVYISADYKDCIKVKDKIIELITNSKIPKKKTLISKKRISVPLCKDKIVFSNGSKIMFIPVRVTLPGIEMDWLLINDIKMIDPDKYTKLFMNGYSTLKSSSAVKLTLSP